MELNFKVRFEILEYLFVPLVLLYPVLALRYSENNSSQYKEKRYCSFSYVGKESDTGVFKMTKFTYRS